MNVNRWAAAAAAAVAVLLVGCESDTGGHGDDVELAHIHGLGIDPADGKLYAASHHGLFQVSGRGEPQQVAGRTQDFMGFTVVGDHHFLGSGHPGLDDDEQPPNLGLIESTDAGNTWTALSLSGTADFHAMEAKHGRVYGFDSQTGQIMVSGDKKTWDKREALPLADIAVSPDNVDEVLATTEQGVQRSTDGAESFSPVAGSPTLIFMDWVSAERLVGIDSAGAIHVSTNRGDSWSQAGDVPAQPEAILAYGDADIYVATDRAIYRSTDNGATLTVFQQL